MAPLSSVGLFFMDVTFFVYLLTFANEKVYVGMSRTDGKGRFTNRYYQHANAAQKGKPGLIYNAWRKHGAPEQTILSTHATRKLCALAEIDAIQLYDSMNSARGYNLQSGGEGMHAPAGSALYELMRAKVWDNPEARRKNSEAKKGLPMPEAAQRAHEAWRKTPEAAAQFAEIARRPEIRAQASERMQRRLDGGYREYLSDVQRGKPRHYSEEGLAARKAKRETFLASDAGKAAARAGMAAMRANPENEAKRAAALTVYVQSDANKAHCEAMAAKSRKPVRDLTTGRVYESRTAAAQAHGVSGPTVGYWIKQGRFSYAVDV